MTEASILAALIQERADELGMNSVSEVVELGGQKALVGMADHQGNDFLVTVTELRHPALDVLTPEGMAKLKAMEEEVDRRVFGG